MDEAPVVLGPEPRHRSSLPAVPDRQQTSRRRPARIRIRIEAVLAGRQHDDRVHLETQVHDVAGFAVPGTTAFAVPADRDLAEKIDVRDKVALAQTPLPSWIRKPSCVPVHRVAMLLIAVDAVFGLDCSGIRHSADGVVPRTTRLRDRAENAPMSE